MRIVSTVLFAGFIVSIADPLAVPEHQKDKPSSVEISALAEVDEMVTGGEISAEHKAGWKARHEAYLRCPECVASQPFPGD